MLHTDHSASASGAHVRLTSQDLEALRGLKLPLFGISEQDREDAIGDALLSAVTSFDPARGQLRSFVHKCAWNRCLNQSRTVRNHIKHHPIELDANDEPQIADPSAEIEPVAESYPWLEKTLARCELLTMSSKSGIRSMAADSIVVLRRLRAMADADDLDELHPKALFEGPLHQAVMASGHTISAKSMWDVARFLRKQVKESLSEEAE